MLSQLSLQFNDFNVVPQQLRITVGLFKSRANRAVDRSQNLMKNLNRIERHLN